MFEYAFSLFAIEQKKEMYIVVQVTIKINRQKLYDEIWEISAFGVAKQYGLNYAKVIESAKVLNV